MGLLPNQSSVFAQYYPNIISSQPALTLQPALIQSIIVESNSRSIENNKYRNKKCVIEYTLNQENVYLINIPEDPFLFADDREKDSSFGIIISAITIIAVALFAISSIVFLFFCLQ